MDGKDQIGGASGGGAYRVLARKYRPASFEELIGQEPMVRTLTNAFRSGRIAQAFMLTGVRGVGKTTTARILARALNYSLPGKVDSPTVDMKELGEHCAAIMEGRHVDVIEMDAASHTGIDDVREITEASRYRPALARYKVYIIDEVHMLSTQAFNGLLKTLEEPPEHVKFIFATTEIRKVPVTVLSRCQRFDLRRIEASELAKLVRDIAAKERIAVEERAVEMLARAGDGSARDTLSLLDQAAASGGNVSAEDVRSMLGLADRAQIIDLFGALMGGNIAAALESLAGQYRLGADPVAILQELAAFTHLVTRIKVVPESAADPSLTEEERIRGAEFAARLSLRLLSRAWQMLLKGLTETQQASRPLAAADMVLVRIAHAADLPTPDEMIRTLADNPASEAAPAAPRPAIPGPVAQTSSRNESAPPRRNGSEAVAVRAQPEALASTVAFANLEAIVARAVAERELRLKIALEQNVRIIRFESGRIEMELTKDAPADLAGELSRKLQAWSGTRWVISIGRGPGQPTLQERAQAAKAVLVTDARADPLVAAVLARFPGAEIVDVRVAASAPSLGFDPASAVPLVDQDAEPIED